LSHIDGSSFVRRPIKPSGMCVVSLGVDIKLLYLDNRLLVWTLLFVVDELLDVITMTIQIIRKLRW